MLLKGAGMLTSCGHTSSSTHGNCRKAGGLIRGYPAQMDTQVQPAGQYGVCKGPTCYLRGGTTL